MKFFSTRSDRPAVSSFEAVLKGIAPDGGLYTPLSFENMQINPCDLLKKNALEIAETVIGKILNDFSAEEMHSLAQKAYSGRFETEDLTPVCKLSENDYILELFRGPTSAFKDVALSMLPHLLTASKAKLGVTDDIVILTATSGDTGKAALEGFHDVPGTRIIVFYPDGGVSDIQKAQMATQEGGNVLVCAVRGNFDDCQTGVKNIFADDQINGWAAAAGARLSSANSINIGRLAPQVSYYFKAYADLVNGGDIAPGEAIDFVVPTGNFGDILAGEFARRMGLPVRRLICASNANNVLTDFLTTGVYDRRRPFYKTVSPSMDILVSSNLERYLYIVSGGDWHLIADLMARLQTEGVYTVPESLLTEIQKHFDCGMATDDQAAAVIKEVFEKTGYMLDTHTAVACCVARQKDAPCKRVILSTASPYKFGRAVLSAIRGDAPEDGFECMDALNAMTGVPVPKNLSGLKGKAARFSDVADKTAMLEYVKKAVRS